VTILFMIGYFSATAVVLVCIIYLTAESDAK